MRTTWWLSLVTAVLVLAVGGFYALNRVYVERYRAAAGSGGTGDVEMYSPTEPVRGAQTDLIPVAAPDERTVPAAALNEAREYAGGNASTSLLIWHKGKLQSAHYWGIEPTTPVNSRSLHKMLGGLLIAAAVNDGHIASIDDPVARYVAAWRGTDKERITIRNVLQMSSGLMWFGPGGFYSVPSRRYLDPEWDRILLEQIPLEFEPGSAYDYSDTTADVMPHIIEGATGERYSEYLSRALLEPIGAAGGRIWVNRPGGLPHGGCCLLLPPETWLRIGVLALNRGRVGDRRLLPEGWMDQMLAPSPNNPHFGLMVWLGQPYTRRRLFHRPSSPRNLAPRPGAYHAEPYLAADLYLFDGMNGQIVYVVPSEDLVIVRTGLRPGRNRPEWDNSRLPNIVLRGLGVGSRGLDLTASPPSRPTDKAPPVQTGWRDELRFWQRWLTIREQTPRTLPAWLDVREAVNGGNGLDMPIDTVGAEIAADAIAAAQAYAATMQSLSLLVWHDGRLVAEHYWRGTGPDDVSETYSMAKSVLGLAVGLAVDRGAIGSIDESVSNYLPEWRSTARETLTIRQLLEMSSGIHHERFDYSLGQSPWSLGLRTFLGADIAGSVRGFSLDVVPGAAFNYNSANTQILLEVVERATGRRYADFVSENLWRPLGARDATLWLDRPGGTPRGYSYFQARPRDWLRLGILMADGGLFEGRRIVSAEWVARMTAPSSRNPNYGFQVWRGSPAGGKRHYNRNTRTGATHSAPYAAADVVFFDGGGGHRVYIVPSRRLVIVRTGAVNSRDWDDAMLPNLILRGLDRNPN